MDKFDDVLHSADLEKYLLGDMKEFWKSMRSADAEGEKQWRALAMHALSEMDLQVAAKIFRHLKDLDILYSLQSMSDIEDKKLLSGHIAVALSDFGKAQVSQLHLFQI
jgi:outer membrane PBP1 activator LpoA protein